MSTLTIPQKQSNSGSIHDIRSDRWEREITFAPGCKYAVVLADYYGGKGYTTHRTEKAAINAYFKLKGFSRCVIDQNGILHNVHYDTLQNMNSLAR